jgi:hypothetical protein
LQLPQETGCLVSDWIASIMSVPAFEQLLHLPRFVLLHDRRCGPDALIGATATLYKASIVAHCPALQRLKCTGGILLFLRSQYPAMTH